MKILTIILIILFTIPAYAQGPYMTTKTPVKGALKFKVEFLEVNGIPSTFSEDTDAVGEKLYIDVSTWPAGTISGIIRAGGEYLIDNVPQGIYVYGEARPFVLAIPGITQPGTVGLEE